LADQHAPIDLLLTDVVMPYMLGKELAERLTAAHPGTRVLYMSGYAQPVLASQGTLDPDVTLLEKPFTKPQLLNAVRDSLNRHPPRARIDRTALQRVIVLIRPAGGRWSRTMLMWVL
jgi:DNA-binding NtrC family response regulator